MKETSRIPQGIRKKIKINASEAVFKNVAAIAAPLQSISHEYLTFGLLKHKTYNKQ